MPRKGDPWAGYTVTRTIRTLDILAAGPVTTTQLAEALQVDSRTARRLLGRLVHDGYATRDQAKRGGWHATEQLAQLGERLIT